MARRKRKEVLDIETEKTLAAEEQVQLLKQKMKEAEASLRQTKAEEATRITSALGKKIVSSYHLKDQDAVDDWFKALLVKIPPEAEEREAQEHHELSEH